MVLTRIEEENAKSPEKILEVVVYDIESSKELDKLQFKNGLLEWVDPVTLKINYTPGNPEKGVEYYFFYNIETKTKQFKKLKQNEK